MDSKKAHPKNCFIITPIGDEGSDIRKRADQVLKHIISPALQECGYMPVRADKIAEPGIITSQVIQHIADDPLVIADLTGANANVYYELALRHAVRKPLVQIIRKGDKLPFDIAGMRTIQIDLTDPDNVEEARIEIAKQIASSEGKKPDQIDSPISVAVELQQLRQSDNPEERSLAQVIAALGEIKNDIASLDNRLQSSTRTQLCEQSIRDRIAEIRLRQINALKRLETSVGMLQTTFHRVVSEEKYHQRRTLGTDADEEFKRISAASLELELIAGQFEKV